MEHPETDMQNSMFAEGNIGRIASLVLAAMVTVVIIINAAASMLSSFSPDISLSANPLDADVRAQVIRNELIKPVGERRLDLNQLLTAGQSLSALDPRFPAYRAMVNANANDLIAAQSQIDRALDLDSTQHNALFLGIALESARIRNGGATNPSRLAVMLDTLSRRNPSLVERLAPFLPSFLQSRPHREAITEQLRGSYRARREFMKLVQDNYRALNLGMEMMLQWHRAGLKDVTPYLNTIMRKLIIDKAYESALHLYVQTREEGVDAPIPYIRNGNFERTGTNNIFEWYLAKQPGVSINISPDPDAPERNRAAIRFLDTPLKLWNMRQWLRLYPGTYELELEFENSKLLAPGGLSFAIQCIDNTTLNAEIQLTRPIDRRAQRAVSFTIPEGKCPFQQTVLFNRSKSENWENRYSGMVEIFSVGLRKTQ